MESMFSTATWSSYALVILAAAVPMVEILVVIPVAILAGMAPVPTAVLAFAGNLSTVVVALLAGDRFLAWWRTRRPRPDGPPSRKAQRARRMAERWGVPALALVAPVSTGTHIAALAGLATGADRGRVLRWMAAGLAVWAVTAAAATALGLDVFAG